MENEGNKQLYTPPYIFVNFYAMGNKDIGMGVTTACFLHFS